MELLKIIGWICTLIILWQIYYLWTNKKRIFSKKEDIYKDIINNDEYKVKGKYE